jgi:hypothetical protein
VPDELQSRLSRTLGAANTIDRELGGRGMSRVYVAEDTRLKRKVVVKVLSPELAAGVSAERFEREIQLAAALTRWGLVSFLAEHHRFSISMNRRMPTGTYGWCGRKGPVTALTYPIRGDWDVRRPVRRSADPNTIPPT